MASPLNAHARTSSTTTTGTSDADNPQSLVITSLRGQVSDLVSQVTQLNSKLVQSYDRISDLEDNMHIASSNLRTSTLKISQLELERTQHLSALNTGLLVEKSHVTSELTRLMERATEEAARRGQAESARQEIEKDLDDLSAELFGRANTMVAEARLAQAKSERRVQDAESVLKGAEDAVASMQAQMQVLRGEKDRTDRELADMRELMGKGKWVERERSVSVLPLRLLSTHAPYQEFLLFVAHLRQIRPGTPQPPPMATLLPLPFLARLVSEDSDPTLRLDAAPALNWLTRRSVNAAIHQLQLTVEPVSTSSLLEMLAPVGSAAAIAAFSSQAAPAPAAPAVIPCALCGTPVLPPSGTAHPTPQSSSSWRPSFFSRTNSAPAPAPAPPTTSTIHSPTPSVATSASFYPPSASSRLSPPPTPPPVSQPQVQVHVFRVPAASGGPSTLYPLCTSGWCLARLRATCEVWRFVRRGVVEKVWAEEVPGVHLEHGNVSQGANAGKPPVPPRRRMNMGKLIGFASSALGMEKGGKSTVTGATGTSGAEEERFSPPPVMNRRVSGERRSRSGTSAAGTPPPLPRRSDGRVVRAEEEKHTEDKHVEFVEKPVPTPIESAMLFDADSTKPDDPHLIANGHANPILRDEQLATVDPAQIPLPASPTLPPEELHSPDAEVQPGTPKQADKIVQPNGDAHPSTPEPNAQLSPSPPPQATPGLPTPAAPSRTTSPAPPPVPRRAARRAAPAPPASPKPVAETTSPDRTFTASPAQNATPAQTTLADASKVNTPTATSVPLYPVDEPYVSSQDAVPRHNVAPPEDHEPYVGDVTWEERTWKELVRLREDMFYARVGTAR